MEQNKLLNLSDEKEYILSGTIEQITSILEMDFGLGVEEARFITYISTIEKKEKIVFKEDELKLWYLNEQIPNRS